MAPLQLLGSTTGWEKREVLEGMCGVEGFEVPVPADDDALECPDKGTKVEWDAVGMDKNSLSYISFAAASTSFIIFSSVIARVLYYPCTHQRDV